MLEILISSSVLIAVLAVTRLLLRNRISARLQYALWLLVLVRLLVPVSLFHSPVSVAEAAAPVVERAEALTDQALYVQDRPIIVNIPQVYSFTYDYKAFSYGGSRPDVLTPQLLVRLIWYAGMIVMAGWFIFINIRLRWRLVNSRRPYGRNGRLPVYVAEGIPSPCLFGLFRPAVYLTEQAASDPAQARQIIAHELTHYRHGDMIWALLRSACLVVWWFDPFVWLAAALSRRDCELACDEGTIKALGEAARYDYGRTLVGMAKVGARPSDLLCGATTMTGGKTSLKERVARIAQGPKTSAAVAVLVLVIAAVAASCTLSGGTETPEPEEPVAGEQGATLAEVSPEWGPVSATPSDGTADDNAFVNYFLDYLKAVGEDDYEAWAAYVYFENDYSRQLAEDNYLPNETAELLTAEQVSPELWAFITRYRDRGGYEYDILQFVGRLDGRLYVFRNQNAVPEEFQEALEHLTLSDPAQENDDIMFVDTFYWDEVNKELASFAYPADIEIYVSDDFDEAIPEDDFFGPMTLEDYIYSTDGWRFTYDSEAAALDPDAQIIVHDADGRVLWIMDDAGALMIEEADGSITWVRMGEDDDDEAAVIRRLLPWARGEYPTEDMLAEQALWVENMLAEQRLRETEGAPVTMVEIVSAAWDYETRSGFMEPTGATVDLDAIVHPSPEGVAVTWSSTDESVATVDDTGLVTITGSIGGEWCDIIASAGGQTASIRVFVQ